MVELANELPGRVLLWPVDLPARRILAVRLLNGTLERIEMQCIVGHNNQQQWHAVEEEPSSPAAAAAAARLFDSLDNALTFIA